MHPATNQDMVTSFNSIKAIDLAFLEKYCGQSVGVFL